MTVGAPGIPHPRIAQRRADVSAASRSMERRRRRTLWTALALSVLLLSGYLATQSEILDVERVTVAGATRTPAEQILEVAAIGNGQPLLGLELAAARQRIARLPWVDDVYSTRSWDGSVRFEVSERIPVAAVAVPGAWAIVGSEGRILAMSAEPDGTTVPVTGLNIADAHPGDWLDPTHLQAIGVAAALYEPIRSAVSSVDWTHEGYVLQLHAPGRVLLGRGTELEAKLLAVSTFLNKVNLRCLDSLDVRAPATPVLTRGSTCI